MIDAHDESPLYSRALRLLGACVLRLQQYERLLKVLLAQEDVSGDIDNLAAQHAKRTKRLAGKTLGHLTRELFESRMLGGAEARSAPMPKDAPSGDKIFVSMQVSLNLTQEQRESTKEAITELVDLRSGLVHHLFDRFDFETEEGCLAAIQHLEQCQARIDHHLATLHQWAKNVVLVRVQAAQALIEKIRAGQMEAAPPSEVDAEIDWNQAGIVNAIRQALQALESDGWASLQAVRTWIGEHHPGESPQSYGRRSWQQVLDESKLFELQYRPDPREGKRTLWLRLR
jgi:OST-HTH/LOTUS domain